MGTNQFFLQMSGVPGSGKTTVAKAVAQATGSIIIDHDVTKSALLDASVPVSLAGGASYKVLQAISKHLLSQGQSVIFDSPCLYREQLEAGQQLASEFGAIYLYVECVLEDLDVLDERLQSRKRHRSQLAGVRLPPTEGSGKSTVNDAVFLDWMANMKRPDGDYLQLDTSPSISEFTKIAVAYVERQLSN